jgi:RNA polymerase sigma factor (sigma-70 family)
VRTRTPTPARNGPEEAARLYDLHHALAYWCYHRFFSTPGGRLLLRRAGGRDAALQTCRVALWEACRRFDSTRGVLFSTYATRCVWCQLKTDATRGTASGPIRLPNGDRKRLKPATQRQRQLVSACIPFDARRHDPPAHDDTQQRETWEELQAVLDRLDPHDALLLRMYHLDGAKLAGVAAMLGRTRERARQLIKQAMRRAKDVARDTP